ncbi:MAG: S-methyl-5-thioribose-1-phosphate isomerase, partial [Chloroflexi bacterium]|nr:S-methyl-5-thioribose-1-phosphate isomerase [Chloroflexota bacterium]
MNVIEWRDGAAWIVDQTRLPGEVVIIPLRDHQAMIEAVRALRIRGAPALGVAGAYGLVLGLQGRRFKSKSDFLARVDSVAKELFESRPTAVNLGWALARMRRRAESIEALDQAVDLLLTEARAIHQEGMALERRLAEHGARLLPNPATVLTHCNTGELATGASGTALGVIKMGVEMGKSVQVIATETRPLLQGARLTAWELVQAKVPVTLITDSMAGYVMRRGGLSCAIVGADRIAANGDTANKIGTYSLAVLAKEHGLSFYIAAPLSTIDLAKKSGAE